MKQMVFAFHEFVSCQRNESLHSELHSLPPFDNNSERCLIVGSSQSGRRSLLFHFAFSEAAAGRRPLIICQKEEIRSNLPVLPDGLKPDDPLLDLVQLKYFTNENELLNFAVEARFDLNDFDCVLIDDISHFIDTTAFKDRKEINKPLYRLLAYLYEMHKTIKTRREGFRLVVTDQSQVDQVQLYKYKSWFPSILRIEGGPMLYFLSKFIDNAKIENENLRLKLCFSCDGFSLESVLHS